MDLNVSDILFLVVVIWLASRPPLRSARQGIASTSSKRAVSWAAVRHPIP
jgi:hypothetical protein